MKTTFLDSGKIEMDISAQHSTLIFGPITQSFNTLGGKVKKRVEGVRHRYLLDRYEKPKPSVHVS